MATHIEVPADALSEDALHGLIEEFVTREGTDYGHEERTLEEKCEQVRRQLRRGDVAIVFAFESESTTLVTRRELAELDLVSSSTDLPS